MVRSDAGGIAYDYLILATGATHFYFGHPEWAAFAPGLKRIEDATRIRRRILLALERAEISDDERERRRLMTFVIVGGGPTGAEMAGAIAEIAMHTLKSDFRNIDPRRSRILLIEAGPRILPAFPPALSDYARKALARSRRRDQDQRAGDALRRQRRGAGRRADRSRHRDLGRGRRGFTRGAMARR